MVKTEMSETERTQPSNCSFHNRVSSHDFALSNASVNFPKRRIGDLLPITQTRTVINSALPPPMTKAFLLPTSAWDQDISAITSDMQGSASSRIPDSSLLADMYLPLSDGSGVQHHHRLLEHAFRKLVQRSGVQSTAAIFTAVTSCWDSLRCLEDICPSWASYTGGTFVSNRLFHRCQLQSGSSLVQLFSYYALLDEVRGILCDSGGICSRVEKIVDALVLLDGMRLNFKRSANNDIPAVYRMLSVHHPNSHHANSERSGNSTIVKEEYDEADEHEKLELDDCYNQPIQPSTLFASGLYSTNGSNGSNGSNEDYVPISREDLRKLQVLGRVADSKKARDYKKGPEMFSPCPLLRTRQQEEQFVQTRICTNSRPVDDPNGYKDEPGGNTPFDKKMPMPSVGNAGSTNSTNSTNSVNRVLQLNVAQLENASGTVTPDEQSSSPSSLEGVSELVEVLDRIREALEVPSDNKLPSDNKFATPEGDRMQGRSDLSRCDWTARSDLANADSSRHLPEISDMVERLLKNTELKNSETNDQLANGGTVDKEVLAWMALANCLEDARADNEARRTRRRSNSLDSLSPRDQHGRQQSCMTRYKRRRMRAAAIGYQPNPLYSPQEQNHQVSVSPDQGLYAGVDLTTPCPGVCWDPTHMRWVAHWSDARTHQRIRKYFNPKLLGFARARLVAILTRKEAVDSERASMMVKSDRPKQVTISTSRSSSDSSESSCTSNPVIPTDDPFDPNYVRGVYYSASQKCWYAHYKHEDAAEITIESFPVADFLLDTNNDETIAMATAYTKALQCRQAAMVVISESKQSSNIGSVATNSFPAVPAEQQQQQQPRSMCAHAPLNGIVVSGRPSNNTLDSGTLQGTFGTLQGKLQDREGLGSSQIYPGRFSSLSGVPDHLKATHLTTTTRTSLGVPAGQPGRNAPPIVSSRQADPSNQGVAGRPQQQWSVQRDDCRVGQVIVKRTSPPMAQPTITASPKPFVDIDNIGYPSSAAFGMALTCPPPRKNAERPRAPGVL